jgi:hypothetical protein
MNERGSGHMNILLLSGRAAAEISNFAESYLVRLCRELVSSQAFQI